MTNTSMLDQAIAALKAGDTQSARDLLTQLVKNNPQEARAWFWLSACWSEPEKKRYCLEKALALQPDDLQIRQALEELASPGSQPVAAEAAPQPPSMTPPNEGEAGIALPETEQSPAKPPTTEPPAAARQVKPARPRTQSRKKSKNLFAQIGIFLFLVVLALAALAILGVIIQQSGIDLISLLPAAAPPPALPVEAPAERPTFALPPTWTPTSASAAPAPAEQPSATLFRPTATSLLTPSPVPSITPFYALWRIVIGQSVENRPIVVFRFGTGKHERLIVAGIHGGAEANTIALADQLIETLQKNPDKVPADVSLYILRSLNPDGEALGDKPEARFNAHGVDLNRNFDQNWKASWKGKDCISIDPKTAGPSAASEPETQAFMKFMLGRKFEALIDYHSAGLGIYPAGQPASPPSVKLAQAIAKISPYAYPPVKTDCEFTGTLVDWAISQGTQAAVDLELNSPSSPELENNLKVLDLLLTWQP